MYQQHCGFMFNVSRLSVSTYVMLYPLYYIGCLERPWFVLTVTAPAADCLIGTQPTCEFSAACWCSCNVLLVRRSTATASHFLAAGRLLFACLFVQQLCRTTALFLQYCCRIGERFGYCLLTSQEKGSY